MSGEKPKNMNNTDKLDVIKKILDVSETDTAYRDVYIEHIKELLSSEILPVEKYHDIIKERDMLVRLPNIINAAMEKEDWLSVKDLSIRMKDLHRWVEENQLLYDIGKEVFDDNKIYINPFSPGLYHFAGTKLNELPILRKEIIKKLTGIISSEIESKDFYISRKKYFDSVSLDNIVEAETLSDGKELTEQIKLALEQGNIGRVEELSERIIELQNTSASESSNNDFDKKEIKSSDSDRVYNFSTETLSKAEKLNLVHVNIEESPEYASLCRHILHTEMGNDKKINWDKIEKNDVYFNNGIPEALKTRATIFAHHMLINSCGTRHIPDFVKEDILVEDFPETNDENNVNDSPLLEMLGLKTRKGLSRLKIEHALSQNAHNIIKEELGLDPLLFKLVCIPSDIYLRLGEAMKWGEQEQWTHFDGYEILKNGRFNALAGGDKRFGGIYDLVSVGREYESDRMIARFAVIMRERMLKMI